MRTIPRAVGTEFFTHFEGNNNHFSYNTLLIVAINSGLLIFAVFTSVSQTIPSALLELCHLCGFPRMLILLFLFFLVKYNFTYYSFSNH